MNSSCKVRFLTMFVLVFLVSAALSGCATIDLRGGPSRRDSRVSEASFIQVMSDEAADSVAALQALSRVKKKKSSAMALLLIGNALACTSVTMTTLGNVNGTAGYWGSGLGLAVAALAMDIAGIATIPKRRDYAAVLEAYNLDNPKKPFVSDYLGVH